MKKFPRFLSEGIHFLGGINFILSFLDKQVSFPFLVS